MPEGCARGFRWILLLCAGAAVLASGPVSSASAQARSDRPDPALLDEFRRDPMLFYFDLRAGDAVLCGQTLLRGQGLSRDDRRRILTALGSIYLSTHRAAQARAAFLEILDAEPTADLDSPAALPPPVVRLFYALRDSLLLATDKQVPIDLRTLAVGSIENNSLVKGKWDLDRFARGLTQILMTDLQSTTPLKLVDRQRLNVLREEIKLSQNEQVTDPAYAVPFGRLCGAQSFLFGSLMQVDKEKIRLDLRLVNTSTGEVMLSEGIESKLRDSGDLFHLEHKVLIDLLVPQIQRLLAGTGGAGTTGTGSLKERAEPFLKAKEKSMPGQTAYLDLLLRTGDAILAEQGEDWAAAQAAWNEVARLAPTDSAAAGRARTLRAYQQLASMEEKP